MTTFRVRLAETPTAILHWLYMSKDATWVVLRDALKATSSDMNLLYELGFIERTSDGLRWQITDDGRAAIVPKEDA